MQEAQPTAGPVPVTTEVAARRFMVASSATAVVLVVLAVLLAAGSVPLYALTHQNWQLNGGQNVAGAVLFSVVGFVIVRRQPRNAIGWILLTAPAGLQLLPADAASYALLAYRLGHRLPFGSVALLLEYSWAPTSVLLGLAILLFPDGRLPSPRWRPVLWFYLAVVGCYAGGTYALAATALSARHVRVDSGGGLTAISSATFYWLIFPVIAALLLSFVVAQVLSWRRSSGERRQQLKWLLSGAAVLGVSQIIFQPILALYPNLPQVQLVLGFLLGLGAAALPASMAVAILKYRLYDIDRIISRTLSYAIVTGLLIGVYTGLVLLATEVFQLRTPVAVAAATLAAAALFNPLRQRVQRAVDRRFNRARYDADKTVAAFAARLKDAVDLDAVQADLAGVVHQALEPAHVSVWMSKRD
ncbi:MAG TPA: hypothetical protein VKG61_19260 [Streptosporangiaceae bacterium]|nr:hypothetical protein [Streptosporangiaceae bacterium]